MPRSLRRTIVADGATVVPPPTATGRVIALTCAGEGVEQIGLPNAYR